MKTAEEVRRARPFLCRTHLWHRWELRTVKLFEGRTVGLWVCKRCRMAHGKTQPFANGGLIPRTSKLSIVGGKDGPPESILPLRGLNMNDATVRHLAELARRKS